MKSAEGRGDIHRLCESCGLEKPHNKFYVQKCKSLSSGAPYSRKLNTCSSCIYMRQKKRLQCPEVAAKNRAYQKEWAKKKRLTDPEFRARERANKRRFRQANPEQQKNEYKKKALWKSTPAGREQHRNYQNRYTNDLTDSYIRQLLVQKSHIDRKDIPPELIEVKRLQMQIRRELKGV